MAVPCMEMIFGDDGDGKEESCVQDEGLCSLLLGTKQQQLGLAEYGATAHHFSAQPQQHLTGGWRGRNREAETTLILS